MGELTDGEPLFPGEDEVHQLIVIQKVIGKFSDEQIEQFNKNPNFNGCKLPDIIKPETLEKRYLGKLGKKAIEFMKQLLHPDPKFRLKGDDIFKHPYFENYIDPFATKEKDQTVIYSNRTNEEQKLNKKESSTNIVKEKTGDKSDRQFTIGSFNNTNSNINLPSNFQIIGSNSNSNAANIKQPNQIVHPTIINKSISLGKDVNLNNLNSNPINSKNLGSQNHSVEKSSEKDYLNDKKNYQSSNNINILNFKSGAQSSLPESNLEKFDKIDKLEKEKNKKFNTKVGSYNYLDLGGAQHNSLSKNKIPSNKNSKNFGSQENLVMTSYGFNKNLKDNILATYGVTGNFDANFKTFYKPDKDKYNYDIDLNFKREEAKNNSLQKKDNSNTKSKPKAQNKYLPTNFKSNYVIPEEGYDNIGNTKDSLYANINSKISPPKYGNIGYNTNFKTKNSFYQNNVQLPAINGVKVVKKTYK